MYLKCSFFIKKKNDHLKKIKDEIGSKYTQKRTELHHLKKIPPPVPPNLQC